MMAERWLTTAQAAFRLGLPGNTPEEKAQRFMLKAFDLGWVAPPPGWDLERDGLPNVPENLRWRESVLEVFREAK
jgi:hypothetical protein